MRRIETYVGQQIYEWAFSAQAQYTMTAIAKISAALLGTAGTVNGLACSATSPATMAVQIGAGEIYQVEPIEATACGTLPQNTTNSILKQGIQLGTYTTATFAAPSTSGQSINYLIEAQYQDSDISLDPTTGNTPVVLQYYNSANPATPWSGPNNSGATSNTFRDGIVAYQVKAGVAATTGSQVTPSPDTGWIGLWVVTVPYGASSLTNTNISQYTGSPILPSGILQSIITSNLTYGIDSGGANTLQAKFPLPVTVLTDQMDVWVKVAAANTGATTFTPNPGVVSASPVVGAAHQALQGGELVAGGRANLVWRQDISSWVLVECTGGALQIPPATQSQHAPQMGQVAGVVGSARNLAMNVSTAAATATLTADEIVVETALGGVRYCLANFSQSINLATTGAGGMDTGTPAAFVAIYAIYNPTTQTRQLLATNAVSGVAPNVYGGANMPTGYTASGLVSVWPVLSSQFVIGAQVDRTIYLVRNQALNTSTAAAASTSLSISAIVPKNAREVMGDISASTTGSTFNMAIGSSGAGSANSPGMIFPTFYNTGQTPYRVPLITAQTVYYYFSQISGTFSGQVNVSGYTI